MAAPRTTWKWTAQRETAAALVAEDKLSDTDIGREVGVSRDAVAAWRITPEFAARVKEHTEARLNACMAEGIADKRNRVRRLREDWERLQSITRARAAEYEGEHPGSDTGLLVRTVKSIGKDARAREVEEWTLDKALLSELREIEQQAAKELGQWVEKAETLVRRTLEDLTDDELADIAARGRAGAT